VLAHWGKLTLEINERRAKYTLDKFGDVLLQDLTAERIERDLAALMKSGGRNGRPLTGKTIREIAALTSQALKKAVRQKRIERNPMEFVDRPRCVPKEVECPETHEFESLLTRIQNARYYAMAIFLADSACRRGEALALRWADVNLATGWITVSKSLSETRDGLEVKTTKSERRVPLNSPSPRFRFC
jgi:integrase